MQMHGESLNEELAAMDTCRRITLKADTEADRQVLAALLACAEQGGEVQIIPNEGDGLYWIIPATKPEILG
jgi:hypothetical protein